MDAIYLSTDHQLMDVSIGENQRKTNPNMEIYSFKKNQHNPVHNTLADGETPEQVCAQNVQECGGQEGMQKVGNRNITVYTNRI